MMTGQFPNQDQEPGYDETLNDDELYTKRDEKHSRLVIDSGENLLEGSSFFY